MTGTLFLVYGCSKSYLILEEKLINMNQNAFGEVKPRKRKAENM